MNQESEFQIPPAARFDAPRAPEPTLDQPNVQVQLAVGIARLGLDLFFRQLQRDKGRVNALNTALDSDDQYMPNGFVQAALLEKSVESRRQTLNRLRHHFAFLLQAANRATEEPEIFEDAIRAMITLLRDANVISPEEYYAFTYFTSDLSLPN